MGEYRWFRCFPSRVLSDLAGMLAHEGLTYVTLLMRVHAEGGPISDSVADLAKITHLSPRKVAEALALLIAAGRVAVLDGNLIDLPETHAEIAWLASPGARRYRPKPPDPTKRMSPYEWQKLREKVFARDGRVCAYCRDTDGPFEVDHIVAHVRGGGDDITNLTVSCRPCNRSKGALDVSDWLQGRRFQEPHRAEEEA